MSLNVIRRILESPGCAKGTAWALLVAMGNRADDDGTGIWESMGNLARTFGRDRATAFRALPELLASGLVIDTGEWHSSPRGGRPTRVYRIDLSRLGVPRSQDATVHCRKERPSQDATVAGSDVPTSQDATQTSPYPVQIDRGIDGEETQSQVATQPETASQPRLVPVPYISANSLTPREPETEKLVEAFLNYQGNPGYNEKNTLRYWHSVLSRLLKAYPSLPAYMRFAFDTDPFWSSGKLIRGKNSKGKDGKIYPDPLDYFEDMLGHIVTNFNRLEKGKAAARARKAAARGCAAAPETEELWDRQRIIIERGLDETKEYVRKHEEDYRRLHPDWHAEFKERGIL
jgi:hypothetical protein